VPQGESVLYASMMAELIVTKKEIAPQLKKSAGPRGQAENPRRGWSTIAVGVKTWGRASYTLVPGFGGRSWLRGSRSQFGRWLKGRSGRTRRRGHESFKAIRKIGGTGSASVAFPLASTWLAGHSALMQRADLLVSPHALFAMLTSTYPSVESAQRI
jgi:hypothetical protein